ncbi:MAG TPA: vWA domain-containing protein [Kofleriaceae bacterium]
MLTRQRIVSFGIPAAAAATIGLAAILTPLLASKSTKTPVAIEQQVTSTQTPKGKHAVDVVFALDTTGSMGSLLDGAKRTIFSVATHIQKRDPDADVRIGLVAYRDVGDEYVTKDLPLTRDIDAVFAELASYEAAGGNDIPEDVDAAMDVALHKMKWRDGAEKLVFVVGDAPPASRGDVPTFDVLAREAATKHIVINAFRAGTNDDTATTFGQIASLTGGIFQSIQQGGGVRQIATPYDDKMAALQSEIDSTVVIMGDQGTRDGYLAHRAAAEAAAPAAKADRAAYYVTKGSGPAGDLVGGIASGEVNYDSINEGSLPADLRGKSKDELAKEVTVRAEKRAAAQKELGQVMKQREEFLAAEKAKAGTPEDAFDSQVKAAIDLQLK